MTLSLTLALTLAALCFAALRTVVGTRNLASANTIPGPDTLEELFAARYARGDIDRAQYRQCVDRLVAQLH